MGTPLTGPVQIMRCHKSGDVPTALLPGQVCINEFDGILFFPDASTAQNASGAYTTIISINLKAVMAALTSVRSLAAGGTGVNAASAADLLSKLGAQPALGFTAENTANKGLANGYAGLGADGKLPTSLIPSALLTGLEFAGTWDASANSPALTSGSGTGGQIYVVATAGSTALDGIASWTVGDWAIFDPKASKWRKLDGLATEVISVAGQTGVITAAALKLALAIAAGDVSGLGTAATRNVGTTAGTVAAGDDSRFATTAASIGAAALDDLRQVLISLAKVTGSTIGLVAGVADDFRDQTGVDTANSVNATYDPINKLFSNTANDPTQALLHFDTGFADASPKAHTFTAKGSAAISSAQAKFGGSSAYFSTTGDGVSAPTSADFGVGSGDYTVEAWVYLVARPPSRSYEYLFDTTASGGAGGPSVCFDNNGAVVGNSVLSSSGTVSLGAWHHIAMVRASGTLKVFIDGNIDSQTQADTTSYPSSTPLMIGNSAVLTSNFNGYIDEFRFTPGLARYSANFTPPTTAYAIAPATTAQGPLDLRSAAYAASAVPSKGSIYLLTKPVGGTITPGTNFTASLSRNGGATYTPVTLTAAGALSSGFAAYEANGVDLTSQSGGQSMKWRIQTTGSLAIQVQAVVEQWG